MDNVASPKILAGEERARLNYEIELDEKLIEQAFVTPFLTPHFDDQKCSLCNDFLSDPIGFDDSILVACNRGCFVHAPCYRKSLGLGSRSRFFKECDESGEESHGETQVPCCVACDGHALRESERLASANVRSTFSSDGTIRVFSGSSSDSHIPLRLVKRPDGSVEIYTGDHGKERKIRVREKDGTTLRFSALSSKPSTKRRLHSFQNGKFVLKFDEQNRLRVCIDFPCKKGDYARTRRFYGERGQEREVSVSRSSSNETDIFDREHKRVATLATPSFHACHKDVSEKVGVEELEKRDSSSGEEC